MTLTILTPGLEIAYEAHGDPRGFPVVLLHGFPDDVRAWDGVAPALAAAGCRVLVPYLRGYGPTRFLDPAAPRMAQQAAIGQDLLDFVDALALPRVALAGYDWGGRAACIAAIVAPARVRALVTIGGYNVQNTTAPSRPASAAEERARWYQWYFNTERGRRGLEQNRREICRLLWREWSPSWRFDDATFDRTAQSFDSPDFVEVVIHSYRHRHGNASGEERFDALEGPLRSGPRSPCRPRCCTGPRTRSTRRGTRSATGVLSGRDRAPGRAGRRPLPAPRAAGGGRGGDPGAVGADRVGMAPCEAHSRKPAF